MREFTKSMTSYTWAMSLFGLQQMVNVFRPAKATQAFINVTKATEDQFGEALRATFRAGDNLQKGLVDVTFGLLTLGMFDRGGGRGTVDVARQTGEAFRQSGRAVGQAADIVGQAVQGATSAAVNVAQQTARAATTGTSREAGPSRPAGQAAGGRPPGWGPMPTQPLQR